MTLAKWNFVSAILVVIALVLEEVKSECLFPNTSMISPTACSRNDSRSLMPRMLACLSYLAEDDTAPNAKCCAGVRNVSAVSPPCLCKHVFYPGSMVNHTRGKLMPVLCNVTFDLCRICSAFLVDRVWEPHHSWANSGECIFLSYGFLPLSVYHQVWASFPESVFVEICKSFLQAVKKLCISCCEQATGLIFQFHCICIIPTLCLLLITARLE